MMARMSIDYDTVFVIGMGEVGRRLAGALESTGVRTVPVTRAEGWEEALSPTPGLRLLCVREEALESCLDRLAGVAPEQLVAVQNGWINHLLAPFPGCTRGLIWFTSKGDFFRVLRPSPFAGPAAPWLAGALERGGLAAAAVPGVELAALDADKMGFNCVVGLPLAVHGVSLGDYLDTRPDEAEALFTESVTVCARAHGTTVEPAWWPRFVVTVEPLDWVKASAAKALEYRNGAVQRLGRKLGIATPVTDRLLAAAGWTSET